MSPSEISETLDRLLFVDRTIAELKALVGEQTSKGAFFEIVRAVNPPTIDGGAWSAVKLNESLDRLVEKKILGADGVIIHRWRDPLVLRVMARPDGAAVALVVGRAAPKSSRESGYRHWATTAVYNDPDLKRSTRLYTLAGQTVEVERLIALAEREIAQERIDLAVGSLLFADCPSDPSLIDRLEPVLADRVSAAHVEMFLDHGVLDDNLATSISVLGERETNWAAFPRLDRALMRLDLLDERPDAARARLARVATWDPVAALGCEAALAFLTGAASESLPLFQEALKRHRKATGRRKVVLPLELGYFHLLALIATDDASVHAEIATLLEAMAPVRPEISWALIALADLSSGREVLARHYVKEIAARSKSRAPFEGPLADAITALAMATVDASLMGARENLDWQAANRWGAHGGLARRIMAEVHGRNDSAREDWRQALDAAGPGYERRFADVVIARPPWDRALDKLQAFLSPSTEARTEPAAKSRRLAFLFDPLNHGITPLEQASKRGGWTAGRPVALKRLHKRDAKLDYLTAEDQKVLNTITIQRDYYEDSYDFDDVRGPLALVGHPRVFDAHAPGRQLELVNYPVELVVREEGDRIWIDLSYMDFRPQVFLEEETPSRWRVIEVTKEIVELAELLGPEGLEAPAQARERVLSLIRTDNPRLPVRSELAGVASEDVTGDTRPTLQISPQNGEFEIHAVVRPMGDEGHAYVPGQGSRSVLVPIGGSHQRLNRDFAGETAALEAVAEGCPALEAWRESSHAWRIDSLEAALEVLQQLHDFDGPLHLEWPQGAAIKPTRSVGADALSLNIASGREWFELKGQIQIDEDLVLDMAEVLSRLGSAQGRFIALDDGRYLALTEELRRRLGAFAAVTEAGRGGRRIGHAGVGAIEDLVNVAGTVTADRGWEELIERLTSARGFEPEIPQGFNAELRDYQREGFVWMARLSRLGLGACLADDMGLGKTIQTLALLLHDAAKGPSLVVAPTSVCHNWVLEAARFAPGLRVRTLASAPDRAGLIQSLGPGDVLVTSYGLLHTEADALSSHRFGVAVFDEAQNLKNAGTRRAQASKRIEADFRLALSGTPVENRLEELWSLYDVITPGLLGSRESFQRRFARPIEGSRDASARQALKTLLRPYLLRRTKAAVLSELPARTEINLEIEPGPEERAFYEALRRKALENLAEPSEPGGPKRMRILAEITRLRRAACNPVLVDPKCGLESAKLGSLLELVAELKANGHRALVFSQFTSHLDLVEAALGAAEVDMLRLDGSTSAKERARRVEAFQAGKGDVFLISLKAGGTGLNLTGADYVIHLDPWWNPAVEDQATDRAHRMGQTMPVTVYRLLLKNSIEEKILALHGVKRALSADFLDGSEQTGALDEDELMALIRG